MLKLKEVWIIIHYNLYESKRYFSHRLAEALERYGITTKIIDLDSDRPDEWLKRVDARQKPDLVCSFNRTFPDEKGQFFWDRYQVPGLSFLVDPVIYDLNLLASPYSLISCVDQKDCELVQSRAFDRVFFWPHAVERELAPLPEDPRPYDVVFLGSSYDPEGLRQAWKRRYSAPMQALIDEATERTLAEIETPFWKAVQRAMERFSIELSFEEFIKICGEVDYYVRGIDRLELIRSIKAAEVHVFGGTCWREDTPILGWAHYLGKLPNVTLHPAVSFPESLQILKQSKICLNSMPFFKKGTHERLFTGLACGSLVLTMDNLWVQDNFAAGQELLTYQSTQWPLVNELVNHFLHHTKEREDIVARGRQKVMKEHTWDRRVEQLVASLAPMLEKF
jgi:spore maturation protein CgeB